MLTLASIFVLLLAYLIGSIPVGVLVGKVFGFDPRAVGSGNIGMTNVGRAGGKGAAALTFAGDVLKGLVPILIGNALNVSSGGLALIAAGHAGGRDLFSFPGLLGRTRSCGRVWNLARARAHLGGADPAGDFSGGAGDLPDRFGRFDQRRAGLADSGRVELPMSSTF